MKMILFLTVILAGFNVYVQAQHKLFFIEGNIGVGKSTFLQVMQEYLDVIVTLEPCDEWQDVSGYNFLDMFYKDGCRWALTFQFYALITCLRKQEVSCLGQLKDQIMERSWFSDRYCFAQTCLDIGLMDGAEWALYSDMWKWLVSRAKKPAGFIYLRADPQVCYDRLKKRARSEEGVVPLQYLEKLHDQHEAWLLQGKYAIEGYATIPVLVLDATLNFKENPDIQRDFMQQVLDFLNNSEIIDLEI